MNSRGRAGAFLYHDVGGHGGLGVKDRAAPHRKLAGSGASPKPDEARKLATNFTNRNKKSLTLNLKEPAGQDILHALAKEYDVLVEGFPAWRDAAAGRRL